MKRSKGLGLFMVFALFLLSYPVSPAHATGDNASVETGALTTERGTCISGAKANCSETAGIAFIDCADELGLTYDDLEQGSSGVYACAAWSGLVYLWCWITSLI